MMRRTYTILGAAMVGLLLVSAFIHWLTGSASVWWVFLAVVLTFSILLVSGVFRPKDDRPRTRG
jgi:hypothetical protein